MNRIETLKQLDEWEKFTHENEDSFLEYFSENVDVFDLISIAFGSEQAKFVYVLDCGQHVCDSITMDKFFDWIDDIKTFNPADKDRAL